MPYATRSSAVSARLLLRPAIRRRHLSLRLIRLRRASRLCLRLSKRKKAEQRAAVEALQQENYNRKKAIVDKISEMGADVDNANRFFQQVRDLQTEFKEIGEVPAPLSGDLSEELSGRCGKIL